MGRPSYAPAVLAAVACSMLTAWCPVAPGQTPLAPEAGVLALRNGHVIHGQVTRAGDYYVVTSGEGSELRLKSDDVESFCATLEETYELKRRHLAGITARPHLELARWCLRHDLFEQCREQLAAADVREPGNAQTAELKRRLELALESPATPAPAAAQPQAPLENVESTLAALPKGSVEKFGAIVQPILLNRCAANQCHGQNSKTTYRLLRPPPGQIVSRRFTQRNLYATLKYLDRTKPDASPLVLLPQQRHGNSLAPVFDKHSAGQLAELVAWARATAAPSTAAAASRPPTIAPQPATLSQPAPSPPAAAVPNAIQPAEGSASAIRVMRPMNSGAGELPATSQTSAAAQRDRYDPEIFNLRYHAR
jgi:hypothetical protein